MRSRMLPADVAWRDGRPHTVRWHDDAPTRPAARARVERVTRVLDTWEYAGRWWELERRRSYLLVETERGVTLELFREGEAWCLSRTSD